MTRLEFLVRLREGLGKLPPEELESAVSYYVEYLDEAGPDQEQRVLEELGDPTRIAQQIVAEYMVRDLAPAPGQPQKKAKKQGLQAVWIAVLAIFASPVALPLAIAVAAVVFAVVVAVLAVVFSLLVAMAAVGLAGLVWMVAGFISLAFHPATGLFIIGNGMMVAGLGLLCFWLVFSLTRAIFNGMARLIRRGILHRRSRAKMPKGGGAL